MNASNAAISLRTEKEAFLGLTLGTLAGDSLGLPYEGMNRRRVRRWMGDGPLNHRLLWGRGMGSDDTEHAALVASALVASGGEIRAFQRALGWRLRGWFLALPPATGWATLRACVRLWIGFSEARSGVWSAGNGPVMRAPMIGAWAARQSPELLAKLIHVSTRITHSDPRAEQGALAVAHAARLAITEPELVREPQLLVERCVPFLSDSFLVDSLRRVADLSEPLDTLAESLGWSSGVTGFVHQTVPAVFACWLRHPSDFPSAVRDAVRLGGDTDSVAALVGALAGATLGPRAIPKAWLARIVDWPLSANYMVAVAESLAGSAGCSRSLGKPLPVEGHLNARWLAMPLRNLVFTVAVLLLALRRGLPPY